jgi:hypothetical protein
MQPLAVVEDLDVASDGEPGAGAVGKACRAFGIEETAPRAGGLRQNTVYG